MRYIVNDRNYVTTITFGGAVLYNDCECTEYTGAVPSGWDTLDDWYFDEGNKLWRWKIVDGNLEMDPTAEAPKEIGLSTPRVYVCTKTFPAGVGSVTFNDLPFLPNAHMYLHMDIPNLGNGTEPEGVLASAATAGGAFGHGDSGLVLVAQKPTYDRDFYPGGLGAACYSGYDPAPGDDEVATGYSSIVNGKYTYTIRAVTTGATATTDPVFIEGHTYFFALLRHEQGV